jgi:hypothetical protein
MATTPRKTTRGGRLVRPDQLQQMRALSDFAGRIQTGERAGITFEAKRDMFLALGYRKVLTAKDYISRYERSEMAERVAEALPNATWRGSGELVEDEDPGIVTEFEEAWLSLASRLGVWDVLRRADILAGLGHYSIVVIGASGGYETELPRMPKGEADVLYLTPYHEDKVKIQPSDLVKNTADPRFGLPMFYEVTVAALAGAANKRKVHHTRVLHVADGVLQDQLVGKPRLRSIWNRLDDLEKVVGGGSEAFWQRVQPGYKATLDRDVELTPEMEADFSNEIDSFIHGMRRYVRLRAVNMESIGSSEVSRIDAHIDTIVGLISAGTGIPKRILMGSERGELASQQDRSNWDQRVDDRRDQFASPHVVRPLVDRLVAAGALPKPAEYDVRWPSIRDMDDEEIAAVAVQWARVNQLAGEVVVTADEIRDRVLNLPPLEEVLDPAIATVLRSRRFLTKRGRPRVASSDAELSAKVAAVLEASVHGKDSVPMRSAMASLAGLIAERKRGAA